MAEVLCSGFDSSRSRQGESRLSAACCAFSIAGILLAFSLAGTAQTAPANTRKGAQPVAKTAAANPNTPTPNTQIPAAVIAPAPAPLLLPLAPVRPPVIAWDGTLLTIDAENSTLSDVLLGIRARTGASIDMPGSASAERVAVHIGPAPIREVLSSLLYGTNFNYVIQASENDESGLGKVILISRDGGDSDGLDSTAGEVRADRNVRLMPGYAAPGKRDFEVAHARAMEEAAAASEAAAADSTNQDASSAATNDSAADGTAPADTQPVASNSDSANSSAASSDATLTAAEQPLSRSAVGLTSAATDSSGGDGSSISSMEQNLQKLYQQRRQIQAQQNQPPRPPNP